MANLKQMYTTCVFLLVLVFSYGIIITEGVNNLNLHRYILENKAESMPAAVDDFRPTTPGYSPGAGHRIEPSSTDPN